MKLIFINGIVLLMAVLHQGCLYDRTEVEIGKCKLRDGSFVEFIYHDTGATTSGRVWVKKMVPILFLKI